MAKLFVEDVAVKKRRSGKYQLGLVVTNYETYESSDEDSDGEKELERINAGQVRVAWYPKGNEEVVDESKISLYDRSLMPGDVVYSLNKSGRTQCGFVRSVNILCHVRIFKSKQMVYDVNSRDLYQIVEFQHGDHVVLGFWLGTVCNVSTELIIKLQNGSRYVVTDEGASKLSDIHDHSEEFSVFNNEDGYYLGQILHGPSSVFKKARWLSGTKPIMGSKTNFRGTVEKVKVTDVEVEWQTRGLCLNELSNDDELFKTPDKNVKGDKLKELQVLQHFKAASVQIGDRTMYTVNTEQIVHPQHVALGSLYCFKQPEPAQNVDRYSLTTDLQAKVEVETGSRQNADEKNHLNEKVTIEKDSQQKVDVERDPQEKGDVVGVLSEIMEITEWTEDICDLTSLKISETLQDLDLGNLAENEDSKQEDIRRTFEHQNGEKNQEITGLAAIENNDNEKCAEASADSKNDSEIGELDLGLLCEIHQQLIEVSDNMAKVGGSINPLISKEQNIVKLLQSRNELHEQITMIEELMKNESSVEVSEKHRSSKAAETSSHISHQKAGTCRAIKSRTGHHKKQQVTAGEEVCVEVTHTSTRVDVTWQDGSTETNIHSSQLCPLNQMDELEFFPGDFVSKKKKVPTATLR